MKRQQPTSFTAGRKIVLGGTTYDKGASIPNATVKGLKRLSALLSRRLIIPNVDATYRRTALSKPTPTVLNVRERAKL